MKEHSSDGLLFDRALTKHTKITEHTSIQRTKAEDTCNLVEMMPNLPLKKTLETLTFLLYCFNKYQKDLTYGCIEIQTIKYLYVN